MSSGVIRCLTITVELIKSLRSLYERPIADTCIVDSENQSPQIVTAPPHDLEQTSLRYTQISRKAPLICLDAWMCRVAFP